MAELTKLVVAQNLEQQYVDRIHERFPDLEVVLCPDRERLAEVLPGAQAMVGYGMTQELLPKFPEVRWIQTTGAGVDRLLFPELIESDIVITNNSGVHAENIAEHLIAMIFAFARRLPDLIRHQAKHEWHKPGMSAVFEIHGQTLGVVGLGDIGCALAWRGDALGMRVVGTKRRASDCPPGVERVYSPDDLHELLHVSDHVAICLPLTPNTHHLFGAAEFAAMKESAYIYNIGRGPIIDQDALIEALRAGEIAGAGLDVTTPEPLPPESPLWDMPNVMVTCHTSGATPRYWDRGIEILLENIDHFRRDEPMRNLVDKREGY